MLQYKSISEPKKFQVVIVCPGLKDDDLAISFDQKSGTLDIAGKPTGLSEKMEEEFDFAIEGTVEIPHKFRASDLSCTLERGIAVIEFRLAKNITILKVNEK